MGRRALLCWEMGRGRGHIVTLLALAGALGDRGWTCELALPASKVASDFVFGALHVHAAPVWGDGLDREHPRSGSSATLGDMLADRGLQSAIWTAQQIGAWRTLFARSASDLIVADFAPGAVLAARDRLPCLAVGTGYSVPPAGLPSLPLLHELSPPRVDEGDLLSTVNAALAATGTRSIRGLAEALRGDAACACAVPLMDPYAAWRRPPAIGPILAHRVNCRETSAADIFCYMGVSGDTAMAEALVAGLGEQSCPVTAFLPNLNPVQTAALERACVRIHRQPAPLDEVLPRCRLILHEGNHGVAAAALLSGVPQLIVDTDIEKNLTARLLASRGVAQRLEPAGITGPRLRLGLESALDDPVMEMEAGRAAAEHETFRNRDVTGLVADACEALT